MSARPRRLAFSALAGRVLSSGMARRILRRGDKRSASRGQGGVKEECLAVRVSLTERVQIEAGGAVVDEARLPGRQGRLVFAYLLAAQGRPVPRDELAEALWGEVPPATWEKALSLLISKLRAVLTECGLDA